MCSELGTAGCNVFKALLKQFWSSRKHDCAVRALHSPSQPYLLLCGSEGVLDLLSAVFLSSLVTVPLTGLEPILLVVGRSLAWVGQESRCWHGSWGMVDLGREGVGVQVLWGGLCDGGLFSVKKMLVNKYTGYFDCGSVFLSTRAITGSSGYKSLWKKRMKKTMRRRKKINSLIQDYQQVSKLCIMG